MYSACPDQLPHSTRGPRSSAARQAAIEALVLASATSPAETARENSEAAPTIEDGASVLNGSRPYAGPSKR